MIALSGPRFEPQISAAQGANKWDQVEVAIRVRAHQMRCRLALHQSPRVFIANPQHLCCAQKTGMTLAAAAVSPT